MRKYYCDHCGKEKNTPKIKTIELVIKSSYNQQELNSWGPMELCDDCRKILIDFIYDEFMTNEARRR